MKKRVLLLSAVLYTITALALVSSDSDIFRYRLASYATYFKTGIEREKNILLAVEKLNGFILHPGSEFSFNESVTWQIPRDELGYAPAILDGELVAAQGGGLCQVSSTLYAVVLHAGLTITERKNHSSPVNYISVGLDATVSSTEGIDLKFRNDGKAPLFIKAEAESGTLRISIFSTRKAEKEVSVSVTAPEKEDIYINVTTKRIFLKNGNFESEIISFDRYIW